MNVPIRNWAGNHEFAFTSAIEAGTAAEIVTAIDGFGPAKVLGSRHSFNTIADSSGTMITLDASGPAIHLDRVRQTVTVSGGARYGDVGAAVQAEGFALTNLASLPHISVAGACATGTHGSGNANPVLASSVAALELVTAAGEVRQFSRIDDPEVFPGLVVHLGALGVVTSLTLDVAPSFNVRQHVYERLSFDAVREHFDEIMSSAYSVSLFTDWQRPEFTTAWRKVRVGDVDLYDPAVPFVGAPPATEHLHPLPGLRAQPCTPQLGEPGPTSAVATRGCQISSTCPGISIRRAGSATRSSTSSSSADRGKADSCARGRSQSDRDTNLQEQNELSRRWSSGPTARRRHRASVRRAARGREPSRWSTPAPHGPRPRRGGHGASCGRSHTSGPPAPGPGSCTAA